MNKTDFPKEQIPMELLFGQLETEVHFLGEKYHTQIFFDCDKGVVWGEKSLLLVAIKNLIDNACKASKAGGEIHVHGRCAEGDYRVQVIDSGHGIPPEELKFILEPFYMVDKARTRKQGGAGLGLSLCSTIVRLHGGEMKVESEPGRGTMVTLCFENVRNGGAENE